MPNLGVTQAFQSLGATAAAGATQLSQGFNAGWFELNNGNYCLIPLGQSSIDEQYTTVKQGMKHKILQFAKACQLTEQNRLNDQQYRTEFLKGLSVAETMLVRDAWAELADEKYFYPVDSSHYLTQFGYQAIHTMQ